MAAPFFVPMSGWDVHRHGFSFILPTMGGQMLLRFPVSPKGFFGFFIALPKNVW